MTWDKAIPANPVVAVAGATGAVGQEFMNVLHDLDFPAAEVRALASARRSFTWIVRYCSLVININSFCAVRLWKE